MILDRFRLDDKVAIVTGAGRGIGRAVALAFAEAGADVALAARTKEQLEEVAATVEAFGRRALVVPCDVTEEGALGDLVDRTVEDLGAIDLVVNNAGGSMPQPFLDTSIADLENAFSFNVTTAFELSKLAVPHMLERGGSIVNIASAIGRLSDRGYLAYGTAKAAMTHMTRLMSADCAPRVRVNAISAGAVATSALEIVMGSEELLNEMEQGTRLRRLGRPEDIALAALYLASPASSWVTGKVLEVDGGMEAPNLDLHIPDL